MKLILSKNLSYERSQSSMSRTKSNSKRGITVTLSQQIRQRQQRSSLQCTDDKKVCNPCSAHSIINTDYTQQNNHIPKQIIFPQKSINNQYTSLLENDCILSNKTLLQSTPIGVYFITNQQRLQAKKQSQQLDEHIKRLQLEIHNTRSKITQTKYYQTQFAKTHNKNKSTISASNNQIIKYPPNSNHHHHYSQINYNPSINQNKTSISSTINASQSQSPLIPDNPKQFNKQQQQISSSSSKLLHSFLLKQMLTSKQKSINQNYLSLNSTYHKCDNYRERQNKNYYNQISINTKNHTREKQKKNNKKLANKSKFTIQNPNNESIMKNHNEFPQTNKKKQNQSKSRQARSFSVNLEKKIVKKDKKFDKNYSQKNQSKIKMIKNNKYKQSHSKHKVSNYQQINYKKNEQSQFMPQFKMQIKKQTPFDNDALKKKIHPKRKKSEIISK